MRVGRYGPYVQRADDETASLPPEIAPDELTVELALELIAQAGRGPEGARAPIPRPGCPVYVLTGRFGPYVQLGEQEAGSKKKPKRASLFATQTPETVTLDEALQLLSLPRVVGTDSEGREIVASPGRFGPYLKRADGDTRSLAAEEQLLTVTLDEAEALYAQPKQRRGRQQKPPIAELGEHPDTRRAGARARRSVRPVRHRRQRERDGAARHGSRPSSRCDEAVALLRARAETAPKKVKKAAKKTAKKAAKKTAKKAAKKAARRRPRRRRRDGRRMARQRAGRPRRPVAVGHLG